MLRYYLKLGMLSIKANWALSTLMVAAIAIGIGACMTIVTVRHVMADNPIEHKNDQLFHVQLDNWNPNDPYDEPNEPPEQVTYLDATALLEAGRAHRQVDQLQVGSRRTARGRRRVAVPGSSARDVGGLLRDVRRAVQVWRRLGRGGRPC